MCARYQNLMLVSLIWHNLNVSQLDFVSLLLIAIGLSADCLAVSIGISISVKKLSVKSLLRVSLAFGLFQALMPILGWLIGQAVVDYLAQAASLVAFLLLAFLGSRMIWSSTKGEDGQLTGSVDYTRGLALITLAFATSVDALAAGLSLALLETPIILAGATIGLVAFAASALGFIIGKRFGPIFGRWAEFAGGLLLIAIGLRIIIASFVS